MGCRSYKLKSKIKKLKKKGERIMDCFLNNKRRQYTFIEANKLF